MKRNSTNTKIPNYIELVNRFWKAHLEHSFTANETMLYFFLLNICNNLGWKIPFRHSLTQIKAGAGLAINTIKSARERLADAGLIKYNPGKRGAPRAIENKAQYSFPLSMDDSHPDSHPDNPPDSQSDRVNKLNKTKLLFNDFRKAFPGNKRGLDPEWTDFTKKYTKSVEEIVPLLMSALEAEKKHRNQKNKSGEFVPDWKNLKTWLNQQCWTQEFPAPREKSQPEYRPPQPTTI